MTQRTLYTSLDGKPATVLMGWDGRLQYCFMVIDVDGNDSDEPLYSNLGDPDADLSGTVDYFVEKAKSYGISIPAAMIARVRDDETSNKTNAVSFFDDDGNESDSE
jgi:hypothetical protein